MGKMISLETLARMSLFEPVLEEMGRVAGE
jgi:hypothetical protein